MKEKQIDKRFKYFNECNGHMIDMVQIDVQIEMSSEQCW